MFTPEAFLDIQVAISGSPHPLEVNIAPDATVGDLKRQVQGQLNAANDPHQLLVLNDTEVLSNSSRLRSVCNNYAKCARDALLQRRYLQSWTKVQYCNTHIFLLFLGSLLKQFIIFEISLQFSSPHPIQS